MQILLWDWILSTLLLITYFPSPSYQLISFEGRTWLSHSELDFLSSRFRFDPNVFDVKYCDISIAPTGWVRLMDCKDCALFRSIIENQFSFFAKKTNFPYAEANAAESTLRWCDKFVVALGLCPWAKNSLSHPGSVRVKIIHDSQAELNYYETAIRAAAADLLFVTNRMPDKSRSTELTYFVSDTSDSGGVLLDGPPTADPKLSITFIVLASSSHPFKSIKKKLLTRPKTSISFPKFYEFVSDLEATLFAEADAGLSGLGDLVTIAGFHPNWQFSGMLKDSAINFEKQSPYPTVSIVLSESIDAAGPEATERIARHNAAVLNSIGSDQLCKMFQEEVLRRPNI